MVAVVICCSRIPVVRTKFYWLARNGKDFLSFYAGDRLEFGGRELSLTLIIAGILDIIVLVVLSWTIRKRYTASLTSVEEKSAGILFFYRSAIMRTISSGFAPDSLESLGHYIAVHLFLPILGLGIFLKTDANFLIVVLSLIWSMQLFQRAVPGPSDKESHSET